MRKNLNIIIISIFIILVMIIALIFFIYKNKPNNNNTTSVDELSNEIYEKNNKYGDEYTLEPNSFVKDSNIFYSVSYGIEKYFNNLYINGNFTEEEIKEKKVKVYQVLDSKYIKEKNITEDNVLEYQEKNEELLNFIPTEMTELNGQRYQLYAVKGEVEKAETQEYIKDCYFIVRIDSINNTFSIYPMKMVNKITDIDLQEINNSEEIKNNDSNQFIIVDVNESNIINRYMAYYKKMILNDSEKAYEILNKEYKEKRFNNLSDFKKYIDDNRDRISNIILNKYKANHYEDYSEYIVIDSIGNYYIIRETATMKFNIMLDTYTIEQEETIDRYNKANEQTKVGMNIEKIKEALNNKDYEYIYNKLDTTFKENNFGSYAQFVSYMKENFFDANKIEYTNFTKEGELYVYEIKVSQADTEENSKKVSIIMKLLSNRDFVMSFSIN